VYFMVERTDALDTVLGVIPEPDVHRRAGHLLLSQ